jgi:hypothetical protein
MKLKTWSDKITFGKKHRGRTVREVMDYPDAQYLWWLIDKTDKTDFPREMQQQIYNQAHGYGRNGRFIRAADD